MNRINQKLNVSLIITIIVLSFYAGVTGAAVNPENGNPFTHQYDTDMNWQIGDFELLESIDDWARGLLEDFELLKLIDFWAGGCYGSHTAGEYETVCQKTAIGTYSYNKTDNQLTLYVTESDFTGCGPDTSTTEFTVQSITAGSMSWIDPENVDDEQMIWSRKSNESAGIVGGWEMPSGDNTYFAVFYQDGSLDIYGYVVNCDNAGTEKITLPEAAIAIDGDRSDWNGIEPVFVDRVNDEDPDADFIGTDLKEFYLAKDSTYIYMMITLNDGDPKTDTHTQYTFEIAQSKSGGSTPGDRLAKTGFKNGQWYVGIDERTSVMHSSKFVAAYPEDHVGAGAKFIEWKVRITDMGILSGRYVKVYIHTYESGSLPENDVSDSSDVNIQLWEAFNPQNKTILIDGNFNDWDIRDRIYLDTDGPDCDFGGQDIQEVYIAQDNEFIYLRYILSGPLDPTFGYKFGESFRHIYVGQDSGGSYIFYANAYNEPQPFLPNSYLYVNSNQFEMRFYKTDVRSYWENVAINAWCDQGSDTVCRDHIELPPIGISW